MEEGSTRFQRAMDKFWMRILNAQAVRNRLIIVRSEVYRAIMLQAGNGRPIKVLSLACGSALAVIQAAVCAWREGVEVRVLLVDKDDEALKGALALAKQHGIADTIATKCGDATQFLSLINDFKPTIAEVIWLAEYLDNKSVRQLFGDIRSSLQQNGRFITSQIHHNREAFFLRAILNWSMNYRTVHEFAHSLQAEGFEAKIFTEPLRIHSVAVATVR
jgi:ribosomal protein L11 methylase PrmA